MASFLGAQERFGIKAAGKITAAAEQAADESDDDFLSRLLSSAIAAKPRGLDLPANVYREWVRMGLSLDCSWFAVGVGQGSLGDACWAPGGVPATCQGESLLCPAAGGFTSL